MDLSRKFRIWQKFASIAALAAAIAALPLYGYVTLLQADLQAARAESTAFEPERQLLRLMGAVQSHRLHAARWIDGDARALAACEADAAAATAALDAVSRSFAGSVPDTDDVPDTFRRRLAELRSDIAARSIDGARSASRHERLVHAVQSWIDATARGRGLASDPGAASGPLLWAGLYGLPRMLEALSLAQIQAGTTPRAGEADVARRLALAALLDRARTASIDADRELERAMQADPDLRLSLGVRAKLASDAAHQAMDRIEPELARALRPAARSTARPAAEAADALDAALEAALQAQAELADAALSAAAAMVAERRTDRLRALMTVVLITAMGGPVAAWLLWTTALSTTQSLAQAAKMAGRFGRPAWTPPPGPASKLNLDTSTVTDLVDAIRRRAAPPVGQDGHDAGPPHSADVPRA